MIKYMPAIPVKLESIEMATRACEFDMPSDRETGSLLRMLCAENPKGRFLEIGTGTGLSACWMLDGMDDQSTLLSTDSDEKVIGIARRHLSDSRVSFVVKDGLEAIIDLRTRPKIT